MEENAVPRAHGIVLAGAYPGGQCALDQLAPRPLLPVAQQPLVTYALRWMASGGLRGATICANSAARAIRASLKGSAFGLRLDYLEDWSPRGAAGCVRDAGIKTDADTFVVADGTAVPVVDLAELLAGHRASEAAITVVVGADAAGRLRPTGVYVFDRWSFAFIPEDGFQDIKEKLIPRLYAAGEHVSTHMARRGGPACRQRRHLPRPEPVGDRADLPPPGSAGRLPQLRRDRPARQRVGGPERAPARPRAPRVPGCRCEAGATLVGPVSIGPGTTVGRGAVVSRSVVWSDCVVGDRAFVDRCMLADGAIVEPGGAVISALKTDGRREAARGARRSARAPWAPIAGVP